MELRCIQLTWFVFSMYNIAKGQYQMAYTPDVTYIVDVKDVAISRPYPSGTIQIKISDILSSIPAGASPSAIKLLFKENRTQDLPDNSTFEVFTLNIHGHRHHHVADASAYSTDGWRIANLMTKFKYWKKHYLEEQKDVIFLNVALSREYNKNLGFLIAPSSQPVIRITVPPHNESSIRTKRSVRDVITTPCRGEPDEGCCLKSVIINLDEGNRHTWWLSPRNFEARVCQGKCEGTGSSFIKNLLNLEPGGKSCCMPAEYDTFYIDIPDENGLRIRSQLGNEIKARSCKCV